MTEHEDQTNDAALDALLRSHLADALGHHVGGGRDRFDQFVAAAPPARRRPWWPAGVAAGVAAAAALVAVVSRRSPAPVPVGPTPAVAQAVTDVPVRQAARWQTIDQGLVQLSDGSPARRLLQRRIDQVRYFDARRNATVEYAEPREQTVYVQLAAY